MNRHALPIVLPVLLALASPGVAQELSREEVLSNYQEAVGGAAAWKDVETMRAEGTMTLGQGMTAPFTLYAKRPNRVRIEFEIQGMTGIQAYDGETAWMIMPFTGSREPQEIPEAQAENLKRDADFDGPLIGWEEEGHQIELVGEETVEGTEAYHLKVTLKDGDVQHYYLDAGAFVPIRITGTRQMQGTRVEYYTELGNYKEVGGLVMAHSIDSGIEGGAPGPGGGGQSITLESIELGAPVPDSLFTMPESQEGGDGGTR